MKEHLPGRILLAVTVAAVALMTVFNLALRQSGFGVTVSYEIPDPGLQSKAVAAPAQPAQAAVGETPAPPSLSEVSEGEESRALVSVTFPLELNGATREQLLFIPQVGEVLSGRIVQYREHLGGYTDLAQLLEIKGIGEATFWHISAYLYLDEEEDQSPAPDDSADPPDEE